MDLSIVAPTLIPPKGMKRKRCKCAECSKRRICEPTFVDGMWVYWCEPCYQENV